MALTSRPPPPPSSPLSRFPASLGGRPESVIKTLREAIMNVVDISKSIEDPATRTLLCSEIRSMLADPVLSAAWPYLYEPSQDPTQTTYTSSLFGTLLRVFWKDPRTDSSPGGGEPTHGGTYREGRTSPNSFFHTSTPESRQNLITQNPVFSPSYPSMVINHLGLQPKFADNGAVQTSKSPPTFDSTNAKQGFLPLRFTAHPVKGEADVDASSDAESGIHESPPSSQRASPQISEVNLPARASVDHGRAYPSDPRSHRHTLHSAEGEGAVDPVTGRFDTLGRIQIPQPSYERGNNQKGWDERETIPFSTHGRPGVRLADAIEGKFEGVGDRDGFPFNGNFRGISIRINFPGYPSSTEVEKRLKELWDQGRQREKARSMQLSTKNYRSTPGPITKSKLLQELAKRIQWHIADLEENCDIFRFDPRKADEKWRLWQGNMKFKHMTIVGLINASNGSWIPIIEVDK